MHIRHLEQFLAVAEKGSLGAASRSFGLSQPAITRNMQALEHALGARLFTRSSSGVTLTPAGQRLLPLARSIVSEARRAEIVVGDATDPGPTLRIGVSPSLLWDMLPETLDALVSAHPDINVTIVTGTMEWLEAGLTSGDIDIALELTLSKSGTDVRNRDLAVDTLASVVCSPYAPAGHAILSGPITLKRLGEARWCIPLKMSLTYRFQNVFSRAGLPMPVQTVNTASIGFIRKAMQRWQLLTILPPEQLAEDIAAGLVIGLDVPELAFDYDVCVLTLPGKMKDNVVRTAISAMKALSAKPRRDAA
ncbi:LysR family transcriptional regulator [Polymorphobacter sp.]|uniref:LysR family transcriptional regulator n=1 Tax=Polymorphobacter sp. TaxID=1909290 RepID=UPI003F6F165A